jgi:hypothetical protein
LILDFEFQYLLYVFSVYLQIGDGRVNEQPLLTVMHTIWLREHNRITGYLYQAVPNQTDEYYYQHARRIVIAIMQHIIYTEYLPVIIGISFNKLNFLSCIYILQRHLYIGI